MEYLSSFTKEQITVPPPSVPLMQTEVNSWPDDVYWNGPRAGGIYEVSNALVSMEGDVGRFSDPAIIDVKSGWMLWGGAWNQPQGYGILGCLWKLKCLKLNKPQAQAMMQPGDESIWCVGKKGRGPKSSNFNSPFPWARITPRSERLYNGMSFFPVDIYKPKLDTVIAEPPPVIYSSLDNQDDEFAWCWLTQFGETRLSESVKVARAGDGQTVERMFFIHGQPIPMGAVGYRVYVKRGKKWLRAAHGETDTYQLTNYRPIVSRITGDEHQPTEGLTTVDALNIALNETNDDIICDMDEPLQITSPIIDEYAPGKFGRTIGTVTGGQWKVQPISFRYDNYPALIVHNQYSHWRGMRIESEQVGLSAGISFADFSGGQAFGNKFSDCNVILDQTGRHGRNNGVQILEECDGGHHSASELIFERCKFAATNPLWIEHKQTCNVIFRDTHLHSFSDADVRNCAIWASTPNAIRFEGITAADCPMGTIISTEEASVTIEHLFVDRGCISLIDFNDYQSGLIRIRGGAVNFFVYPGEGENFVPALVRATNTRGAVVEIDGLKTGDTEVTVSVNGVEVSARNTSLIRTTIGKHIVTYAV